MTDMQPQSLHCEREVMLLPGPTTDSHETAGRPQPPEVHMQTVHEQLVETYRMDLTVA